MPGLSLVSKAFNTFALMVHCPCVDVESDDDHSCEEIQLTEVEFSETFHETPPPMSEAHTQTPVPIGEDPPRRSVPRPPQLDAALIQEGRDRQVALRRLTFQSLLEEDVHNLSDADLKVAAELISDALTRMPSPQELDLRLTYVEVLHRQGAYDKLLGQLDEVAALYERKGNVASQVGTWCNYIECARIAGAGSPRYLEMGLLRAKQVAQRLTVVEGIPMGLHAEVYYQFGLLHMAGESRDYGAAEGLLNTAYQYFQMMALDDRAGEAGLQMIRIMMATGRSEEIQPWFHQLDLLDLSEELQREVQTMHLESTPQ